MTKTRQEKTVLTTLPTDGVRRVLWRFADRPELAELVRAVRAVARGPVARLVADGGRNTHDWTEEKAELLTRFDEAGITALFVDSTHGGSIRGPKALAVALAAFELAWVDGGAATCSMASHLALAPIAEKGTPDQKAFYMRRTVPGGGDNGDGKVWRGAFCLTEPLPYVGVDTGTLEGRIRIAEWPEDGEPVLEVTKRGRFITNMGFADFVTAAVDSGDDRIRGSCMVILHEDDEGTFDRGTPNRKLVHQLSSNSDPSFRLRVPASRIVGGYTVDDRVLVPRHSHSEVIEAVFRRPRATVGLMTAAKLLSAIEPIIRYQRERFRGGTSEGSRKHELGLQQREDSVHRLVDVWATGEAAASLGFAAARLLDELVPLERHVDEVLGEEDVGNRRRQRTLRQRADAAREYLALLAERQDQRDNARLAELAEDPLIAYLVKSVTADVLGPASKLWGTGQGVIQMREAVSLMGGFGIVEDCPGFLGQKWMDIQLEATYEGPEAVQRRLLSASMKDEVFVARLRVWMEEMRRIAGRRPGAGAEIVAAALDLWLWTLHHLETAEDADGKALYSGSRQGVTFPMVDALCWILASRLQILDVLELIEKGAGKPELAGGLPGWTVMLSDLAHLQAARAGGEVGALCAELVFGYHLHPSWEEDASLWYRADELDALEGVMPGFGAEAFARGEVLDTAGEPPAGQPRFRGADTFHQLRRKLDGCLTGARLAKDRAARQLTKVQIPQTLDYPPPADT